MRPRDINSLILIKEARECACRNEVEKCVSSYAKAFYLRCTDEDQIDIEFTCFFRYQWYAYMRSRSDLYVSLGEGDEISCLIRDTYRDMRECLDYSPFNVGGASEWNLLKAAEIDFGSKGNPTLTA